MPELLIEIFYYAGEADKENRMNEVAASATYNALPTLPKKTKRQACFSALFQEPKLVTQKNALAPSGQIYLGVKRFQNIHFYQNQCFLKS